jgi:multidrug efflux pump
VQAKITAASRQLPQNLPSPPTYRKVNPADSPIMILSLTSETVDVARMYDAASSILQQKLSQLEGVGQVMVGGSALPAVRVELNPTALNRYGIGLEDVRATLAAANANRPKGELRDGEHTWQIATTDQLWKAHQYEPLIVTYRNGAAVRLDDVGDVVDSVEDLRNAGLANGKPAVVVVLFRQPGANILSTVDGVYAILPQLRASIPAAIDLEPMIDRTPSIRASIADVERALVISIVLVVLVVFVFLRDPWATLVPGAAVPLSLIGTFGVMYLCGYSLDNLSLMALTISTGFVVDDAIVVIENVSRYLERGLTPRAAAMRGSREVSFTVLSMSLSLVAVFLPILLMGGIVGRLFREFAVTLTAAIAISLVVSLTTTPMLCSVLLRKRSERHGRFYRASERAFDRMHAGYRRSLAWVLDHAPLVLAVTIATLCLNVWLYVVVPKGFFPEEDSGRVAGSIQAAQDVSFQSLRKKLSGIVDTVAADPAVDTVVGFTGGTRGTINTARVFVQLKPRDEREPGGVVLGRLRGKLAHVPGATLFLQPVQELRIGGRSSNANYQFTLQGQDVRELDEWSTKLLGAMRGLQQITDLNSDQQDRGLEASLVIDRDTAARLGITTQMIDQALYDAFGQRQVSTIFTALNQYHVVMEVAPEFAEDPAALANIYVRSSTGADVPLAAFTHYEPKSAALAVNHQGQFPAVTLSFNLAPGVALGQAVDAIEATARRLGLPSSIRASFQGTAQAFQSSLANEPVLILAALVTVYIVLGILYESLVHPITILSTLPSAGVGAILALLLCRMELSVIALIGIILLIGIVKKNAIMMIDFAVEAERNEGKSPEAAIYEACLLRFRPIMMTTMAALLGGLPLALGTGMGSELRRPLGVTIVGGLLLSQLLTLYTTPVVYLYLDRMRLWFARARRPRIAAVDAT